MRILKIAAVLAAAGSISLAAQPAEAQKFPPYVKDCKKSKEFERAEGEYVVPVVGGGVEKVRIVSQNYDCTNKSTRNGWDISFRGLKNASGKLVIPYAYEQVFPFSTTGAVVGAYGELPFRGQGGFRVYLAGKGEGKEKFSFHPEMLVPNNGCPLPPGAESFSSVSAVISEDVFNRKGWTQVTLFTPEGKARVMETMGGNEMKRPVRRVGDVLLARWFDEKGVMRSGILDLYGRPITPVLSNAALWGTPTGIGNSTDGCNTASLDLFIEGPSLDFDPTHRFFGPLLIPVGRDGQPITLPKGAIGLFPVYRYDNPSRYSDAPPDMTDMWAVVFPKGEGFEFTLHLGPPSEALVAAPTAPRYDTMARTDAFGGLLTAKQAAGGKWATFHASTFIPVGDVDADFDKSLNSAWAILEAREAQHQQWVKEENAKRQAQWAEERRRNWQAAKSSGQMCLFRLDSSYTREDVEEFIAACGPDKYPGLASLAMAKGVPQVKLDEAANAEAMRVMQVYKARAAWEEEQRLIRMRTANKDPGASYIPGQWESAIRNAGNAATDAINQSSDNWLQQRRDQYIADWQRSQRAY